MEAESPALRSDQPAVQGCKQGAGPLWSVSMAISASSGLLFNLDAVEKGQQECVSATRGAPAKPLVAVHLDTFTRLCTRPSKWWTGTEARSLSATLADVSD